jgi:hypothetical protein
MAGRFEAGKIAKEDGAFGILEGLDWLARIKPPAPVLCNGDGRLAFGERRRR